LSLGLSIRDTRPRELTVREYNRRGDLVSVMRLRVALTKETPEPGCGTATWSRHILVKPDGSLTSTSA
jgi:hypothetical protein